MSLRNWKSDRSVSRPTPSTPPGRAEPGDGGGADEGHIAEVEATVRTLTAQKRARREAYLDKIATELVEIDRSIGVLQQDLAKAELFERASLLKSPVAGRVQQVEVNTPGEVVQTGQRLMVIVPDGTALESEAMLLNRDKGFVHEGQDVRVKLEAFPFTKYGTLKGKVLTVSNDAIPSGAPQAPAAGEEAARDAAGVSCAHDAQRKLDPCRGQ
nr:HlyD family efflux transporter periplasmic adaptor subunit [Mesorhizobium sp.]